MRPKSDRDAFPDEGRTQAPKSGSVTQLRRNRPATSERVHHEQRANHPEYPLERTCTHLYEPFQLTFARHAQQLFPQHEDVELLASHQGLTIRAETEEAIAAGLRVLKDFYGPQISVSPPMWLSHYAPVENLPPDGHAA